MEIKDGAVTTTLPDTTPTMTHDEWLREGAKRFGDNYDDWKFVCPICRNVAAIGDYKRFKDAGANRSSATQECLGRYTGAGPKKSEDQKQCDYALYGLFRFAEIIIILPDGEKSFAFAFADPIQKEERASTTENTSSA